METKKSERYQESVWFDLRERAGMLWRYITLRADPYDIYRLRKPWRVWRESVSDSSDTFDATILRHFTHEKMLIDMNTIASKKERLAEARVFFSATEEKKD